MKSLLVYLKDYKKESILGPLFKLLEASFELMVPLVVASIVDIGIVNADKKYIIVRCVVLAALGLTGLLCSVTAQFFAAKAAVGFATGLRHALFAYIQGFSFAQLDQIGTSTLITRMTVDVNQVQSGVNMVLRLFLRSPFIIFGAMIMAFTVDPKAALIFVILIPVLSVTVIAITLISVPLFRKIQAGLDKIMGITRENLTGVRIIRAFRREESEKEKFHQDSSALLAIQMFTGRITGLMGPLTIVIVNISIIVLLHTGAVRVEAGILTQGAVIALVNYMSQILVELVKLANLIITVTKAFASANRIEAVFAQGKQAGEKGSRTGNVQDVNNADDVKDADDIKDADGVNDTKAEKNTNNEKDKNGQKDVTDRSGRVQGTEKMRPYIEFNHVSFRYPGAGEEALSDIGFQVNSGQTIGIIGGTGSGKSSLVHLLPRFYEAEKGSIRLAGKDIRKIPVEILRSQIGIVMQKAVLFQGTIRENLLWGRGDAAEEEIWEGLRIAQAEEVVKGKEEGLEAKVEQEGRNFSGGQRQRLTIARALVRKPEILILDDSASALDYITESALRTALRDNLKDTTVFIVSQRASSVLHADKILVLEDGKIAGMGTHQELLADCPVYREIYDSQFDKQTPQTEQRGGLA